ncbi:MAG: Macrolide export ATP-binding/permease protein MacB [Verrucomicrobia subdivision 3 bacterium]|nr:Macrolide export ATP-binding/permease protein MacB [Limisphaerales bacterium]MCS1415660.1 Macrolide export ATP-binding/permease protein MacB [Limisphaerales bacterium]
MRSLSQVAIVTGVCIRTISQRLGSAVAAAFGIAGVVAVMVGVLSIGEGLRRAMTTSSTDDGVIIMRSGADSEMSSGLSLEETRVIEDSPMILSGEGGKVVSAELFVVINLPKRSTGTDANVPLRGVQGNATSVRPYFRLVAGRMFERGKNEVIVGVGASREFAGLELGDTVDVGPNRWAVVGVFESGGGTAESEIWTDAAVLQAAYRRGSTYQSVHLRLKSGDEAVFQEFKDVLTTDPRVNVKVIRQVQYYAEQSAMLSDLINVLGGLIAMLMGIGAIFGALNTMYSSVSARTLEIATLRALGFGAFPVVVSVLVESLMLSLVGGTIGGAFAFLAFDGFQTATLNWQSFSQVTFAFDVSVGLLLQGIVYATFIGLVGGCFPAWRAAKLPIAAALRAF